MQLSTATRNARLAVIASQAGAGGTLKIYTGASPGVGNTPAGTLLSTLTAVTFAAPAGGAMAITATADPAASGSGTPGYVRLSTSGGVAVADFTAGIASGECSFSAAITSGGIVSDTSFVVTEGNA